MEYLAWNDLLTGYFFKPETAGKRVRLSVTSSVIEELGRASNSDLPDFIAAIKSGPPWATRSGVCQKALQAMFQWRERRLLYPPYVAYLSLFVLAAGWGEEFAPHAYYPRLRTLLDEPSDGGQYPSFNRMLDLWDDLERWANEDMHGEFGEFRADIAGGWINVGLPVAQVILIDQERQRLQTIFAEAGLDPTSSPSDEQMIALLLSKGHHRLRARTLRLLQEPARNSSELRELLVSTVLEELREWDGEFAIDENHHSQIYSILRLCGHPNRVARSIKLALRCKSRHELPEEGLVISLDGENVTLRCLDYLMGWSTEFVLDAGSVVYDPVGLDWKAGVSGTAEGCHWRFHLPASDVRIFEDGSLHAISGIVEISRLPKNRPFYLACHTRTLDAIEKWGSAQCQDFIDLSITSGLPPGWKLFHAAGAKSDELVRERFPNLAFNSAIRLYFEGGIRSWGNHYFSFGLPQLMVEGSSEDTFVFCDESCLNVGGDGKYHIPDSVLRAGKLSIEVRQRGAVVARRSLFISDDAPVSKTTGLKADRFGRVFQAFGDEPFGSGATASFEAPVYDVFFLPDVKQHDRLIFIGHVPGEIAFLTAGERPRDWTPVWAITMHRKGTAIFCGTDLRQCAPSPIPANDKRGLREWKRILWHRRKRIVPPSDEGLKRLWLQYQERASKL